MASIFTKAEEDMIAAAKSAWETANKAGDTKGMEEAHAAAEAIRNSKGYTGGNDGGTLTKISNNNSNKSGNNQYTVSTGAVTTYTPEQNAIKSQMTQNSLAWHTADDATRKQLEAANQSLASQLGGNISFDDGYWSGAAAKPVDGFSFISAPNYQDNYSARIDAMLDQILNRDKFSYDAETDPLYQQYKTQYQREGDRAMQNTLGEVSARTGGLASSYATTAAQQTNQQYAQQLADKVPELYQLAYQMYLDDINLQVQDLGLLQGASDTAYNRYRDTMSDWYADRDFAYGIFRDDVADGQWQTQFDYNANRDSIADKRYDTEWEYQLSRDEVADQRYDKEWAYQVAQDSAAAARQAAAARDQNATYSDVVTAVASYLGISEKEANALRSTGSTMWSEALKELGIGSNAATPTEANGDEPELDMKSVQALGYGPISETRLAELVKSGEVEMYVEGGKTKFRRATQSSPNSLFSRPY